MSKIPTDKMPYDSPDAAVVVTQHSADDVSFMIEAPVTKLDADQYSAEDLDGVTESLFGSGNLNFLMMQTAQTNDAIAMRHASPVFEPGQDYSIISDTGQMSFAMPAVAYNQMHDNGFGFAMDRSPNASSDSHTGINFAGNTHANTTMGSLGASSLAANSSSQNALTSSNAFNTQQGLDGRAGSDGRSGNDGSNGTNGTNGTNGANGTNGSNGNGHDNCHGDTTINVDVDINLGDTINICTVTDVVNNTVTVINNVLQSCTINELLNVAYHITNNVTNTVDNVLDTLLCGNGGLTVDLNVIIQNVAQVDLNAVVSNTVNLTLNTVVDLTQFAHLTDKIIDLNGPVAVIDVDGVMDLLGLGQSGHNGDTDLAMNVGSGIIDVPLVNSGMDVIINHVEDLTGDIDIVGNLGLDLLGSNETGNAHGDTDINLGLGVDLIDHALLSDGIQIGLDPIEAITGDIDLDVGAAVNVLGDMAGSIVDQLSGGSGQDNILTAVNQELGNLIDPLLGTPDTSGDTDLQLDVGSTIIGNDAVTIVQDVVLDPIEQVVGDIDVTGQIGVDLLNASDVDNAQGDTDLGLHTGLDVVDSTVGAILPDIALDHVEAITGDIDLGIDTSIAALDPVNDIVNDVTDVISDLGGISIGAEAGLEVDIGLGADAPSIGDILNSVTSDLDAQPAVDLLTQAVDQGPANIVNTVLDSITTWTETTLPNTGSLLDIGQSDGGLGAVLPDPVGSVAEGLGGLLGGGHDGGGHHGHHFGGLFG